MGNTVSNNTNGKNESITNNILEVSDIDTLNWDNINTDDIKVSDIISSNNNIDLSGSLEYLKNLDIPSVTESENIFTVPTSNIETINFDAKLPDISDTISNTSPFISSEMYKFVMKGGADHNKDDDSESSATSSSSSSNNDNNKKSSDHSEHSEHSDDSDDSKKNESPQTGGSSVTSASYISSSDHCGSPTENDETSAISTEDRVVSSSLNTSDINLISLKN